MAVDPATAIGKGEEGCSRRFRPRPPWSAPLHIVRSLYRVAALYITLATKTVSLRRCKKEANLCNCIHFKRYKSPKASASRLGDALFRWWGALLRHGRRHRQPDSVPRVNVKLEPSVSSLLQAQRHPRLRPARRPAVDQLHAQLRPGAVVAGVGGHAEEADDRAQAEAGGPAAAVSCGGGCRGGMVLGEGGDVGDEGGPEVLHGIGGGEQRGVRKQSPLEATWR